MTEKQVITVIGMPQTIWRPYELTKFRKKQHFIGYQYSSSPSSVDYRLRQVYFDNGIVAEIISEYYYD